MTTRTQTAATAMRAGTAPARRLRQIATVLSLDGLALVVVVAIIPAIERRLAFGTFSTTGAAATD